MQILNKHIILPKQRNIVLAFYPNTTMFTQPLVVRLYIIQGLVLCDRWHAIQNTLVRWIELHGNRGGTGWRPLNIQGLWICWGPQVEACEYMWKHHFYMGLNSILITLLWGVGEMCQVTGQVTGDRWKVTGDKWQVSGDGWKVTGDRWQVTGDRWQGTGIRQTCQKTIFFSRPMFEPKYIYLKMA